MVNILAQLNVQSWIEPGCETENIHREILVSQLHWKLLLLPDCCAFSLFFGLLGIRHTIDSSNNDEGIFLKERNLTCGKNLNKFQQPNAETLLFFCVYEKQHPHHTASECREMRDAWEFFFASILTSSQYFFCLRLSPVCLSTGVKGNSRWVRGFFTDLFFCLPRLIMNLNLIELFLSLYTWTCWKFFQSVFS